jgi:hypothetical protein
MVGKLNEYLHEVDEECYARLELLVEQMRKPLRFFETM